MNLYKKLSKFVSLGQCIDKSEILFQNTFNKMGNSFSNSDYQLIEPTAVMGSEDSFMLLQASLITLGIRLLDLWKLAMFLLLNRWSTLEHQRTLLGQTVGQQLHWMDNDLPSFNIPYWLLKEAVNYWLLDFKTLLNCSLKCDRIFNYELLTDWSFNTN